MGIDHDFQQVCTSLTVYLTTGNDILCGAQVNVEYKPGRSPRDPWPRRLLALPGKIRDRYTPFAREVERGQYLPPGYGLAWHRLDRRTIIAYPMPLNVAARIIYKVWAWCLWPFHEATWLERMIAASRVPDSPEVKAYWRESDGRKLQDDLRAVFSEETIKNAGEYTCPEIKVDVYVGPDPLPWLKADLRS